MLALDISKILKNADNSNQIFIPIGFDDRRDHLVKGDKPILFHFLLGKDWGSRFITFQVHYKDVSGTEYRQGVFCICDEHGIEINPFLPEILN